MPTLDDLHDAFDQLAAAAPRSVSPAERGRHRLLAAGVTAACVAAAAVAIPLAVSATKSHPAAPTHSRSAATRPPAAPTSEFAAPLPAPADGQSPALTYGFSAGAAGYTARPDSVGRTFQHATMRQAGSTEDSGELFVFYSGAYDPTAARRGEPVQVGDVTGYFTDLPNPDGGAKTEALVWPYYDSGSDQAWAMVYVAGDRRPAELALANSLAPASVALKSPVRLPAGTNLYVSQDGDTDALDGGIGLDVPGGGADQSGLGNAWTLGYGAGALRASDKPGATTTTIAGRTWIVYLADGHPAYLGLVADGWGITIAPQGGQSFDQLKAFAATLQFASTLSDRSTWFDASAALP